MLHVHFNKSETKQTTPHEPHQTTNPTQGYIKQNPPIQPSHTIHPTIPVHIPAITPRRTTPHHTTPLRANPPTNTIAYEKKKKLKKTPNTATRKHSHPRSLSRRISETLKGNLLYRRISIRSFVRTLAFTFCTLDRHSWIRLID